MAEPAVVAFSQRDPRWSGELLGTSQLTLGRAGCLVTAAAGLLASWGRATDPAQLNEFLRRSHGFVDDCLFLFAGIDALGARFGELIDCARTPAPVDRLAAAIGAGAGCLAMVDWQPGGTVQPHWVRITALTAEHGRLVDPWQAPGREAVDLATYLASGWTPARGIFMAALYSRVNFGERQAWRSLPGQQPWPCLRAEAGGGADAQPAEVL